MGGLFGTGRAEHVSHPAKHDYPGSLVGRSSIRNSETRLSVTHKPRLSRRVESTSVISGGDKWPTCSSISLVWRVNNPCVLTAQVNRKPAALPSGVVTSIKMCPRFFTDQFRVAGDRDDDRAFQTLIVSVALNHDGRGPWSQCHR